MKPSALLRMTLGLAGLTAALALGPTSRAQADVAPDHFDGTDSWAAAAAALASKSKLNATASTTSTHSTKPVSASVQPVAARTVVNPRRSDEKKRKSSPRASN
jgi:hypothetical protein